MASKSIDRDKVHASLETFASDMVLLVKSLPDALGGDPELEEASDRLANWSLPEGLVGLPIAVSPERLSVGGVDFGGPSSRIAELAALLFSHGVGAFSTARAGRSGDVRKFAALLAEGSPDEDESFIDRVESLGITWIAVALDAESAKEAWEVASGGSDPAERMNRVQRAWMILQATPPDARNVAAALRTRELWEVGDSSGAYQLSFALCSLGKTFDEAARLSSDGELDLLARRVKAAAKMLKPEEFQTLLVAAASSGSLGSGFAARLVEGASTEELASAAARIISSEGAGSAAARTIADRLASSSLDAALEVTSSNISGDGARQTDPAPWRELERLLRKASGPKAADGGRVRARFRHPDFGSVKNDIDFSGDPESNLDHVYIAIAMAGGGSGKDGWEALFSRIGRYVETRNSARAMSVVTKIDQITPFALDSRPELLTPLVDMMLSRDVKPLPAERARFISFVDKHRAKLAEPLVIKLGEADRASHRKMIVEALSGLNRDATPMLVSRARRGPWYLTRNLLIVLARRKDPTSLPYIVTALDSQDERVARTALRALAEFGDKGKVHLAKMAGDEKRSELMRKMAARLSARSVR